MTKGRKSWFCEECGTQSSFPNYEKEPKQINDEVRKNLEQENDRETANQETANQEATNQEAAHQEAANQEEPKEDNGCEPQKNNFQEKIIKTILQGKYISLHQVQLENEQVFFLQKYGLKKANFSPAQREYFENILLQLKSPELPPQIRIVDYKVEQDNISILIDYFKYQVLENIFQKNQLPTAECIADIALSILYKIRLCHEAGFIHGCLHPGCIIHDTKDQSGTPDKANVILQNTFYISKENHVNPGLKLLYGIAGYSSPELWAKPERLHPSIDFFSFGSILYFLGTQGQHPPQVLFPSKIPTQIRAIVLACRHPQAEKRPADVYELEKMLCECYKRPYQPENLDTIPIILPSIELEAEANKDSCTEPSDEQENHPPQKQLMKNPIVRAMLTPLQRMWEDIYEAFIDSKEKLLNEVEQFLVNRKELIITKLEQILPFNIRGKMKREPEAKQEADSEKSSSTNNIDKDIHKIDKAARMKQIALIKLENLKDNMVKSALTIISIGGLIGIFYGLIIIWQRIPSDDTENVTVVKETAVTKEIKTEKTSFAMQGQVYSKNKDYEEWQSLTSTTSPPIQGYFKTDEKSEIILRHGKPDWKVKVAGNSVLQIQDLPDGSKNRSTIRLGLEDGSFFFHTTEASVLFELEIDNFLVSGRKCSFNIVYQKGVLEVRNSNGAINIKTPTQGNVLLSAGKRIKIEQGKVQREQNLSISTSEFAF